MKAAPLETLMATEHDWISIYLAATAPSRLATHTASIASLANLCDALQDKNDVRLYRLVICNSSERHPGSVWYTTMKRFSPPVFASNVWDGYGHELGLALQGNRVVTDIQLDLHGIIHLQNQHDKSFVAASLEPLLAYFGDSSSALQTLNIMYTREYKDRRDDCNALNAHIVDQIFWALCDDIINENGDDLVPHLPRRSLENVALDVLPYAVVAAAPLSAAAASSAATTSSQCEYLGFAQFLKSTQSLHTLSISLVGTHLSGPLPESLLAAFRENTSLVHVTIKFELFHNAASIMLVLNAHVTLQHLTLHFEETNRGWHLSSDNRWKTYLREQEALECAVTSNTTLKRLDIYDRFLRNWPNSIRRLHTHPILCDLRLLSNTRFHHLTCNDIITMLKTRNLTRLAVYHGGFARQEWQRIFDAVVCSPSIRILSLIRHDLSYALDNDDDDDDDDDAIVADTNAPPYQRRHVDIGECNLHRLLEWIVGRPVAAQSNLHRRMTLSYCTHVGQWHLTQAQIYKFHPHQTRALNELRHLRKLTLERASRDVLDCMIAIMRQNGHLEDVRNYDDDIASRYTSRNRNIHHLLDHVVEHCANQMTDESSPFPLIPLLFVATMATPHIAGTNVLVVLSLFYN